MAKPMQIGQATGLAMKITKPSSYSVDMSWSAVAGATAYKVALSNATTGSAIANTKVTGTTWSVSRDLRPGDTLKLTVSAMVGKRSGKPSSTTAKVPDLTPPTGAFTVAHDVDSKDATVTRVRVADDSDGTVTQLVTWGDGKTDSWSTTANTLTHTYPTGKKVYYPTVELTDPAGNKAVVSLDAVAIDDTEKPTASDGAFKLAPGTAWAKYTVATVTQVGTVSDDLSQPKNITRTINWGDQTTSVVPAGGMTAKHVYATAGSFTPTVILTDEAKRASAPIALSPVTVKADTVAPKATLAKPRLRRNAVRSWVRLHGRATDVNGTGVREARVRIVEKRAGAWFAYRAGTRTWVKAGTKARALKRSRPAVVHPTSGKWVYRVRGLRKGTLVVKVWGTDNVGNMSTPLVYKQRLIRR
ncbi:MAG TPA: hypothetical protein VK204_19510 [Nocardioidaceae bacterium]|nr:hypothetical protein [Nocardioidaceae bacterium]